MSTPGEQIEITIDPDWVVKLKNKLKETEQEDWRTEQPTIYRVTPNLRGIDPKAYEPTIVSLGPFHHHKSHLKAMDHLKWYYVNKFLGRNPENPLEDYLKLIKDTERQARMAYSEEAEMSSDDFVQMMLLDCCFVIETVLPEGGRATIWSLPPVVGRDMLIPENQLPFCLLQPLFDSAFPSQRHELNNSILSFPPRVHKHPSKSHLTIHSIFSILASSQQTTETAVNRPHPSATTSAVCRTRSPCPLGPHRR